MRSIVILACLVTLLGTGGLARAQDSSSPVSPSRTVAITIDDVPLGGGRWSGDSPEIVARINARMLEALAAYDAPAIGFVTESRIHVRGEIDERMAILRSWAEAGFELGNHGFSHAGFQSTPFDEFQDEVIKGEVMTAEIIGRRPEYFRFPFNQTGPTSEAKNAMRSFLDSRGYTLAPFTVEHSDYIFNALYANARGIGDEEAMHRILDAYLKQLDTAFAYAEHLSTELFGREIPQVFLIHANEINATAMAEMLDRLEARGYGFVALDTALADEAYASRDEYVGPWGISWLHRWTVSRGLPLRRDEPDPPPEILDAYRALTRDE